MAMTFAVLGFTGFISLMVIAVIAGKRIDKKESK